MLKRRGTSSLELGGFLRGFRKAIPVVFQAERTRGFSRQGHIWEFQKIRVPYLGGPYDKDPTISGTILGSPIFGNFPMVPVPN